MPSSPREQSDLKNMFVDTHTHLFLPEFNHDRDEVVRRALNHNVLRLFLPNVNIHTIEGMLTLADKYPENCFPMIGLHPSSIKENYKKELDTICKWLNKRKFYAIGETGIDLYWDKSRLIAQQDAFVRQIRLAKEYHLPVVIHSRESLHEIFEIMDEENTEHLTGVFHSFTGTIEQAEKIISYGFKIGIGGIVTFRNAGLDHVVAQINPDHIVLETDSPYLAPVPERGHRNEPAFLLHTARKIAELHHTTVDETARITTLNALQLFQLLNTNE